MHAAGSCEILDISNTNRRNVMKIVVVGVSGLIGSNVGRRLSCASSL
jgi:hypothetical protein